MDVLNHERINHLLEARPGPCVSVFMPMHPAGRQRQQDPIRLKNLLAQAEAKLLDHGLRRPDAQALLEPAVAMRADAAYWQRRGDGMAIFCAPGEFQVFRVPLGLDEQVAIGERFHVKPLLPLLRHDARFFVLALTQDDSCLYEATPYSIRDVELPRIEYPELDGVEPPHQYHSHREPSQGRGQMHTAIYHGHGGPGDRSKTDLLNYFRAVDRAVTRVLRGARAPLVLACVGYLAPIYEEVNSYRPLLKAKVPGNPERWSLDELRERAWKLVEPTFRENEESAFSRLLEALGRDAGSADPRKVVVAASQGRVGALFLQRGARLWGRIDEDRGEVKLAEDGQGDELLDYAAMKALTTGAEVYALDQIPELNSPLAATYRY